MPRGDHGCGAGEPAPGPVRQQCGARPNWRGPALVSALLRSCDPVPGLPVRLRRVIYTGCVLAGRPDSAAGRTGGRDRVGAGASVVAPTATVVGTGAVEAAVIAGGAAHQHVPGLSGCAELGEHPHRWE